MSSADKSDKSQIMYVVSGLQNLLPNKDNNVKNTENENIPYQNSGKQH